jgi:hypothetical protein
MPNDEGGLQRRRWGVGGRFLSPKCQGARPDVSWAAPKYYGMRAFAQCGAGRIIGSSIDAGNANIAVHATQHTKDRTVLTLITRKRCPLR